MIYELIVTALAEDHTIEASFYFEEQQPGLAGRFLSELEDVYEKLALHPEYYSFISDKDKFRDIKLHSFPYVVIYEIEQQQVIVIDVFNTYRQPI